MTGKSLLDDDIPAPPQKPKPAASQPPVQRQAPPPQQPQRRPASAPSQRVPPKQPVRQTPPVQRPITSAPKQQRSQLPPPPTVDKAEPPAPDVSDYQTEWSEHDDGSGQGQQEQYPDQAYNQQQAPAATYPPPSQRPQPSYGQYQRPRAPVQYGGPSDESRRAAIEAYRRRKEQQGVAAPQYGAVRVARRADEQPYDRAERESIKRRFARTKDKWGVAKGVTLIVILFILFMLPMAQPILPQIRDVLMSDLTEPSPRLFPEYAEYHMQRVFGLDVKSGTVTYDLKVPVPYNIPGGQEIIEFSAAPVGTQVGTDMKWNGDASSNTQILVSYHFKATTVKWSVTPETSGTPADVPASYQKYLGDEWKIKPSNPDIKTLAKKIAGDKPTVYEKLDALATWMRNNIIYEKARGWQPKDPLETLSDGTGDCDDQSILFASLARAQGIPVWLEMGALYDEFAQKWGGHAWLKAYIPIRGASGMEINMDPANKEFLVRDPYRLTEWQSDGNGDDLQNYYTLWQFSYQGDADYDASADYVDLGYKRSTGSVSDKPAGSGNEDWQKSYRMPGFELLGLVPALGVALVVARRKLKEY